LDKVSIRSLMKRKRLLVKPETFFFKSQIIIQKVLSHSQYQQAHTIGIYVSLPQEVNTIPIIEFALLSHRVCVPRVQGDIMDFYEITSLNELQEGHFHVLEPTTPYQVQPQDIDLMIIPMLAYDDAKYRVGYGKGYYDKYMRNGFQGYKLGLAFSFQYVDHIMVDQYDVPLDEILTEKSI